MPVIGTHDYGYSLFNIWAVALPLKLLLMTGYHLTDFDVHRNWMAITHNLPLLKWYVEATNQWTLDYPPFFAYFEWVLSQFVPLLVRADGALDIVATGDYGLPTVYYQRATVIVSELLLFYSLQWFINTSPTQVSARRSYVIALLLALCPGLLICDHIHFQYNGFLFGMLTMTIGLARIGRYVSSAAWFAVLLCFKHIYLYLAPAIFIFLLSTCIDKKRWQINFGLLFAIGATVLVVFAIAFVPFISTLPQLVARLFPFSRGLTHAYWAPNMWAVYSFIDRVLIQVYRRLPLARRYLEYVFGPQVTMLHTLNIALATRGIVGDIEFLVLPTITPKITFVLTLFYMVMALIPLFFQPTWRRFVGALTLCGYASFLFGWHVHEKAILVVIWPFTFIAARDKVLQAPFNLVVAAGFVLLFPLIFTPSEWGVKVIYTALWYLIFFFNFNKVARIPKQTTLPGTVAMDRLINMYILGLIPLIVFTTFLEVLEGKYPVLARAEFLKLMITLVYCAVGVISSWCGLNWVYFVREDLWGKEVD